MPIANKGVLMKCDPPTKQFLMYLNEHEPQHRFVIEDLDDEHLFIIPDPAIQVYIREKIDEWNEKNTYQAPTRN